MKLSEQLIIAMEDLEKCEQDPKYEIDMTDWHRPTKSKCYVCLAGAVMAKSLDMNVKKNYSPATVPFSSPFDLLAINKIRYGLMPKMPWSGEDDQFWYALPIYYYSVEELSWYAKTRPEWKLHMATMIGILQAEGM